MMMHRRIEIAEMASEAYRKAMETQTLEPVGSCETPKGEPKRDYLFNKGNAKELSRKALEAREAKRIERENRLKELEEKEAKLAVIMAVPNSEQRLAAPIEAPKLSYQQEQLAQVREQVSQTQKCLTNALGCPKVDAQAVDRLVNALTRLREQERILDGRPLPGSMRPEKPSRRTRAGQFTGPLDEPTIPTAAPLEPKQVLWSDYDAK